MSQVGDPFGDLLADLAEGVGRAVVVPAGADLRSLAKAGQDAGVVVVDVPRDPQLRAFALGPLVTGLRAVGSAPTIPLVGAAGLPERIARQLRRAVREQLSALDERAGVLLLVHDRGSLDAVSREWLDTIVRVGDDLAVAWVVCAGEDADGDAPPADLTGLDGVEWLLARVLALSDPGLTAAELGAVTGETPQACALAADSLQVRGIVAVCAGRYVLRSAEQREQLGAELPRALRHALQRGVLRIVRRRVDAAVLAERTMASARPGDPLAIGILTEAMDALAGTDPDAAADYGTAAVASFPEPDDRLTALAWRLLPLLWQTARADEARRLARRVFTERGRAEAEAQVLLWLARFESSAPRAVELAAAALDIPDVPATIRARLHSVHLRTLSTLGRVTDVARLLPIALAEAGESGDGEALSRLQTCDAIQHFYRGEYARSVALTALAVSTWHRSGAPTAEWMPEMIWSPHLDTVLGDADAGLRRIEGILADLADLAAGARPFATRFLHGERALALLVLGRLDDAKDAAVLATTVSRQLWSVPDGAEDRLQATALSVRLKVALHQGDPSELDELHALLARTDPEPGTEAWERLAWWNFLLDDARGTTAHGLRTVDPATLPPVSWLDPADEVLVGRALLMHGHREAALDLVERAVERVDRSGTHPLAVAVAAHLRGLARQDAAALDDAVRGWRALGRPLTAAAALSDLGANLLAAGDPAGLALMEQAHDALVRSGADRDAWRIRWFLRVHGHVVDPRTVGSPALTPTERRVVDRAARGGPARRIAEDLALSPHTVTTHLRHVYAKLGIGSRAELAEWVRAR